MLGADYAEPLAGRSGIQHVIHTAVVAIIILSKIVTMVFMVRFDFLFFFLNTMNVDDSGKASLVMICFYFQYRKILKPFLQNPCLQEA